MAIASAAEIAKTWPAMLPGPLEPGRGDRAREHQRRGGVEDELHRRARELAGREEGIARGEEAGDERPGDEPDEPGRPAAEGSRARPSARGAPAGRRRRGTGRRPRRPGNTKRWPSATPARGTHRISAAVKRRSAKARHRIIARAASFRMTSARLVRPSVLALVAGAALAAPGARAGRARRPARDHGRHPAPGRARLRGGTQRHARPRRARGRGLPAARRRSRRCRSRCPRTRRSSPALSPRRHGVRDNGQVLGAGAPVLAERLRERTATRPPRSSAATRCARPSGSTAGSPATTTRCPWAPRAGASARRRRRRPRPSRGCARRPGRSSSGCTTTTRTTRTIRPRAFSRARPARRLRRRGGVRRPRDRRPARRPARARPRLAPDRLHGRPRREPGRARRARARALPLRHHGDGAARRPLPGPGGARPQRRGRAARGRRADGARPRRAAAAAGRRRRQRASRCSRAGARPRSPRTSRRSSRGRRTAGRRSRPSGTRA